MDCCSVIDLYNKASEILQYDLLKLCLDGRFLQKKFMVEWFSEFDEFDKLLS